MKKSYVVVSVLCGSLLFLPHCDWFKGTTAPEAKDVQPATPREEVEKVVQGEVLVSVKGKPVLTAPEFEEYLVEVMKADPQMQQIMAMMPNAKYNLFETLANQKVMQNYIKEQGLDKTAEYQKEKKLGIEFLDQQLAMKYFLEEYPKKANVQVADAEAQKIYDERKSESPELIISRGGVDAVGVLFDSEDQAKEFYNKIKDAPAEFDQIVKDQNLTSRTFKQVGSQSFELDAEIREKLADVKTFPSVDMIKVKDGKIWVVKATGREEAQYVPFEQVKDPIKQQLKMQKIITVELPKLKESMGVTINEGYFKKEQEEAQAKMKALREEQQKRKAAKAVKEKNAQQKVAQERKQKMQQAQQTDATMQPQQGEQQPIMGM